MPRDPFFKTRAAEIAANIIMAELQLFKGSVFSSIDCDCVGDVYAVTTRGNRLVLRWDVDNQCIRTVESIPNPALVMEIAA